METLGLNAQPGTLASRPSNQQARIAVGVESIMLGNGMRVGRLHLLETAERGDEHEQGRARQMEIGQQHIDGAEAVARRDEDVCIPREWADDAILTRRSGVKCRPAVGAATAPSRAA